MCRDLGGYTLDSVKHMLPAVSGPLPQTVLPEAQCLLDFRVDFDLCRHCGGVEGQRRKSPSMTRHDFIIESSSHAVQCAAA